MLKTINKLPVGKKNKHNSSQHRDVWVDLSTCTMIHQNGMAFQPHNIIVLPLLILLFNNLWFLGEFYALCKKQVAIRGEKNKQLM